MTILTQQKHLEVLLRPHELVQLSVIRQPTTIECKQGILWITRPGDYGDYILRSGGRYVPGEHEKVVIEALQDAHVYVTEN